MVNRLLLQRSKFWAETSKTTCFRALVEALAGATVAMMI